MLLDGMRVAESPNNVELLYDGFDHAFTTRHITCKWKIVELPRGILLDYNISLAFIYLL